jgi:hypothetical protein
VTSASTTEIAVRSGVSLLTPPPESSRNDLSPASEDSSAINAGAEGGGGGSVSSAMLRIPGRKEVSNRDRDHIENFIQSPKMIRQSYSI